MKKGIRSLRIFSEIKPDFYILQGDWMLKIQREYEPERWRYVVTIF
ncbi:MAG: hypothetical protein RMZ69_19645 [Nostoc sp. ChiQUE01a]|nr:hypothetical protein [Nostoc sp. ChiQUE01a]